MRDWVKSLEKLEKIQGGEFTHRFWVNRSFFAKKWANKWFSQKNERFAHAHILGEGPERIAHSLSVLVSNLSEGMSNSLIV